MPPRKPMLWVLTINRDAFQHHVDRVMDQTPELQDHGVAIVSRSNLQGISFQPGDVLHILDGFAMRSDAIECEQALEMAKLSWVPETWWFSGHLPRRSMGGMTPAPPLSNRTALENWLATP